MDLSNYSPIVQLILGITTILVTVLGAQASTFFNTKINIVKEKVKDEKVNKYIDSALGTIQRVVVALNQTTVGDLKLAASDGKLTKTDIAVLTEKATKTVLNTLSSEVTSYLTMTYGDIQEWIKLHIENYVAKEKQDNKLNMYTLQESAVTLRPLYGDTLNGSEQTIDNSNQIPLTETINSANNMIKESLSIITGSLNSIQSSITG